MKICLTGMRIHLKGTTPVVAHLLPKKPGTLAREGRAENWVSSVDGIPGIPVRVFQEMLVSAASRVSVDTETVLRGAAVQGIYSGISGQYLVPVQGRLEWVAREVEINGERVTRRIPEIQNWEIFLDVSLDPLVLSLVQVLAILKIAGTTIGFGMWRPELGGEYGKFSVLGVADYIQKETVS